jgi:hypothetical protein
MAFSKKPNAKKKLFPPQATLEEKMQRKKNKPGTLLEQRNGIGAKSLGDKYYKSPDYSVRFFHPGEAKY